MYWTGAMYDTVIGDKTEELQFLNMLNRILPQEIRVTGWAPVPPQFNARLY